MGSDFVDFSRWLTWVSVGLNVLCILLVVGALMLQERRFVRSAGNALIFNGVVLIGSAIGLMACFVVGRYEIEYVYNYSEKRISSRTPQGTTP